MCRRASPRRVSQAGLGPCIRRWVEIPTTPRASRRRRPSAPPSTRRRRPMARLTRVTAQAAGCTAPKASIRLQPNYFPFVRGKDDYLEGFFEQEATVAAILLDWGKSWIFAGQALGLNPYCPADPTERRQIYRSD